MLKSYSAYAVGEILLVMIGILLAIQVNNRNEARKEREHLRREYEEYIYNTIYTVEDFRMLLTEKGAKKFMYTILQIPTFTNGMISASRNQNTLIRQSEKILDLIDNLLSQIEEELNR
ncbi:MAG: hypothetical protein Sapg2KO_16350 [Saprospiraceae bacterium]